MSKVNKNSITVIELDYGEIEIKLHGLRTPQD